MKPTYLGIGAQKCASTWIHRILQDHPQVCVSTPKELDFFSHYYDRGFQWYERHFDLGGCIAAGEISPSYFYDSEAPLRAWQYNPHFKIIVALRDPLERAYSNHLHEIRAGHHRGDNLSFEAGLANNPMYLEQSRYATHLKRWLARFRRDQILVMFQEEIELAADEQARRLYQFLEIDARHTSSFAEKRANESRKPRLQSLNMLFKETARWGRNAGFHGAVARLKHSRLIAGILRANTVSLRSLAPPMLPETRRYLERELTGEVLDLADLLGRDTLPWPIWERAVKYKFVINSKHGLPNQAAL
ncbi:MAG: sulfotransferase domain-containing protein [Pseudomonadota bacterium]